MRITRRGFVRIAGAGVAGLSLANLGGAGIVRAAYAAATPQGGNAMLLTRQEEAMLRGEAGPGVQRCMDILVRFGKAMGAERLVPIASGHTMPTEPVGLLKSLTEGVTSTGAYTDLHALMDAYSPESCKKMGQPEAFQQKMGKLFKERQEVYLRCGFMQTYTCLCTLVGNLPRKGDYISWIGSGTQLMANSLVGARCNRDGTVLTLAAAITGRTPLYGLLLDENRHGQVLVNFAGLDLDRLDEAQLGAIGYHLGGVAGTRNLVLEGVPADMKLDKLKYLMAPMAVTGAVGMCHVVGMTPEAPTTEAALGGNKPELAVTVGQKEIDACLAQYPDRGEVDMAIFGCPHCTITETKRLAELLDGRKLAKGKRLWIGLPHQHYKLAQLMGYTEPIEAAGGVFASSCMSVIPQAQLPEGVKVVATNSFKSAHYVSRLSKGRVKMVMGDMEQCISAITGGTRKGGAA